MVPARHLLTLLLLAGITSQAVDAQDRANERLVHRTPSFTEEGTESCLRCHSGDKIKAIQASPHGDGDNPHSPAAQHGCETCHGPGSIHISRAHGGRGFPPLTSFGRGSSSSPREEQLGACLQCHSGNEAGVEDIGFVGSAHDRRTINCSTCHKAHVDPDPMRDRAQQATTCYRCHRRQKEEHPRFEDKAIDFDTLSCWTCHDVHAVQMETGQRDSP